MAALSVGLTGGIGSGKSEVTSRLASHGVMIVDADKIAREVVAQGTDGLAEVVREFGSEVLTGDGALDRGRLGEIVFAEPSRRERLNSIVHPRVRERAAELQATAPDDAVVVHDVPLLVENGLACSYDVVVIVEAPVDTRIDRLTRLRGMPAAQAKARVEAQASGDQRRAVADVVIDNNGSLDRLHHQVDDLWRRLLRRTLA